MTWQSGSTQRIRYYDDQLLTARDLQDEASYQTRLRELHVRALHNTWGVALGFEVVLSPQQASVQMGPGLAYDCRGREIVSARPLLIKLPNPPDEALELEQRWVFDLVIRYADSTTLVGDCPRTGTCFSSDPAEERPLWRWVYAGVTQPDQPPLPIADQVRLGEEIPIVRLQIGETHQPEFDTSQRRNTQGLTRPYLASGQVRQDSLEISGSPLAWSVFINTASSGFSSAGGASGVFYFANLLSHPFSAASGFAQLLSPAAMTALTQQLLGPFVSIASPYYASGFLLNVRFAARSSQSLSELLNQYRELRRSRDLTLPVGVHWLGVELVKGCPPPAISELLTLPQYSYLFNFLPNF
jgi:hypothetical protein